MDKAKPKTRKIDTSKYNIDSTKGLHQNELPPKEKVDAEKDLRSDLWEEMNINDLWNQRVLLNRRITLCQQLDKPQMLKQMERGLAFLDVLIQQKTAANKNLADQVVVRF